MEQVLANSNTGPVTESVPIAQKQQGIDVDPDLKRKNQQIMQLQKTIVRQQKERTKLRENIERLEKSINLDGLYN